jgi:amidase/aspartyl-tRNA(Asn)/glutamyl-tRNA(Gln) amidotransferase subunit A
MTPHEPWITDAVALAPSFDTAGWFTASAADMQAALAALVGEDSAGSPPAPRGCYLELPGLDPEVALACRRAADRLASPASSTIAAELLHGFAPALDAYHTTVAREAWEVHRGWAERFRARYDPLVWQRLNRAHSLTTTQVAAAAATVADVRRVWANFFRDYEFLILPATPVAAPTKAECTLDTRNRLLALTAPASLGGCPVLTIPVPLESGLSTGLQVVVRDVRSRVLSWVLARIAAPPPGAQQLG